MDFITRYFGEDRRTAAVLPQLYNAVSADDTGALDTLNEVSLAEHVDDYERSDNEQSAGISDRCLICGSRCKVLDKERFRYRNDIRHKRRTGRGKEQIRVEVIRPLPREREQEDRDHHRDRERKNYPHKGSECSRAVDVSRLLKLIGHAAEELTHHVYVQSVLKGKSAERE